MILPAALCGLLASSQVEKLRHGGRKHGCHTGSRACAVCVELISVGLGKAYGQTNSVSHLVEFCSTIGGLKSAITGILIPENWQHFKSGFLFFVFLFFFW